LSRWQSQGLAKWLWRRQRSGLSRCPEPSVFLLGSHTTEDADRPKYEKDQSNLVLRAEQE
jgi:hypothetical protein